MCVFAYREQRQRGEREEIFCCYSSTLSCLTPSTASKALYFHLRFPAPALPLVPAVPKAMQTARSMLCRYRAPDTAGTGSLPHQEPTPDTPLPPPHHRANPAVSLGTQSTTPLYTMATRPDRLFGLLALLAIIAAFVLTVAAALVAIFVFYLDLTIFFVSLLVVSALLFIPALVCHSVFLCCRPTRCPAIAAAVLSGLFSIYIYLLGSDQKGSKKDQIVRRPRNIDIQLCQQWKTTRKNKGKGTRKRQKNANRQEQTQLLPSFITQNATPSLSKTPATAWTSSHRHT